MSETAFTDNSLIISPFCRSSAAKHRKTINRTHISHSFSLCPSQDVFYHFLALLFYFAAFTLEAAVTAANRGAAFQLLPNGTICMSYPASNIFTTLDYRQYSINVAATVSVTAFPTGGGGGGVLLLRTQSVNICLKFSFFLTDFCIHDDAMLRLQLGDGPEKMEDVKEEKRNQSCSCLIVWIPTHVFYSSTPPGA